MFKTVTIVPLTVSTSLCLLTARPATAVFVDTDMSLTQGRAPMSEGEFPVKPLKGSKSDFHALNTGRIDTTPFGRLASADLSDDSAPAAALTPTLVLSPVPQRLITGGEGPVRPLRDVSWHLRPWTDVGLPASDSRHRSSMSELFEPGLPSEYPSPSFEFSRQDFVPYEGSFPIRPFRSQKSFGPDPVFDPGFNAPAPGTLALILGGGIAAMRRRRH